MQNHQLDIPTGRIHDGGRKQGDCKRCGVKVKMEYIAGGWKLFWLVNGIWTRERPDCVPANVRSIQVAGVS